MSSRDPICTKYFNQTGITVTWHEAMDIRHFACDTATIARLTGAPDGSSISVRSRADTADCFVLVVKNDTLFKYPSEYVLFNETPLARPQLLIESMYVREEFQQTGIGTRSAMISVVEAKASDFAGVKLLAAGDAASRRTFIGYHVWPQLGFDAPLLSGHLRSLPQNLAGAARLSDLMLSKDGRLWWYDHGSALELEFDLADDSASWQVFACYVQRKGIRL